MESFKILVLVRHAHRNTMKGRERDNGLSSKGKAQARAFQKYFQKLHGNDRFTLISSPKKRCTETLAPLARRCRCRVKVSKVFSEPQGGETAAQYKRRIRASARWWKNQGPKSLVVCSHGDWIPLFTKAVLGIEIALQKGGWLEMNLSRGKATLVWLVQGKLR